MDSLSREERAAALTVKIRDSYTAMAENLRQQRTMMAMVGEKDFKVLDDCIQYFDDKRAEFKD